MTRLRLELRTLSVLNMVMLRTRDNQLHHPANVKIGLVNTFIMQQYTGQAKLLLSQIPSIESYPLSRRSIDPIENTIK